jgi:LacI family transcriptional regulator
VGVIFSGCERETTVQLTMDWSVHSAVIVGNAPWTPELHRACHNHHLSAKRAMQELVARNFRRPATVLNAAINERTSRAWEGAFLAYHPVPDQARPLLRFADILETPKAFRAWIDAVQPDAMVISHPSAWARIQKLYPAAARRMGFVALDLLGQREAVSGIAVRHELVAANAVDLVVGQMHRNETGVPSEPHRLLIAGDWYEGRTLQ